MIKHSNDKRVVFNTEDHSYFLGKKRLTSVTTFLSKFKNEFNSDFYSKKSAEKEGVSQQEILDRWKAKAVKSTTIGTAIHKIFEDYTLNNYAKVGDSFAFEIDNLNADYILDFEAKKKVSFRLLNDFFETKRIIPMQSEVIVYNEKLAGQIDLLAKDKSDNYYILDFKTNEKLETNNFGKYYKGDLNFLEESTMHTYCLQLSIYKNLMKQYDVKKLFIIHITNENYQFIEVDDFIEKFNLYHLIK